MLDAGGNNFLKNDSYLLGCGICSEVIIIRRETAL